MIAEAESSTSWKSRHILAEVAGTMMANGVIQWILGNRHHLGIIRNARASASALVE